MRLVSLRADHYRGFKPLWIDFDRRGTVLPRRTSSLRFLVGPNGVGKSALLRFIAAIFAALESGYEHYTADNPAYTVPYTLEYELNGQFIEITSQGKGLAGLQFRIDGEAHPAGRVPSRDLVLPFAVLIYTAGDQREWQRLLQPLRYFSSGPEGDPLPEALLSEEQILWEPVSRATQTMEEMASVEQRRVQLIEPPQMPLALLALLLGSASQTLLERLGLTRLVHFSLVMAPGYSLASDTDRELLERLFAARTLALGPNEDEPQMWLYDLDRQGQKAGQVAKALSENPHPYNLFRELNRLHQLGILLKVNLVLEKRRRLAGREELATLLLEHLSDGEASYLLRMALIHVLPETECLVILDEPETHFNDAWKRGVIDYLERALQGSGSQVLLTTHDSITLSDAFANEIVLLWPAGQRRPPPTLGTEPGEILQSVYGAEVGVGARGLRLIEEARASGDPERIRELLRHVGPGLQRSKLLDSLD